MRNALWSPTPGFELRGRQPPRPQIEITEALDPEPCLFTGYSPTRSGKAQLNRATEQAYGIRSWLSLLSLTNGS